MLNYGLQYAISHFYRSFQSLDFKYKASKKTNKDLVNFISDPTSNDFTMTLLLYLDNVLDEVVTNVTQSVIDYNKKLLKRSLIFYVLFVILLILSVLFIVGYLIGAIQKDIYLNKKFLKFIPKDELLKPAVIKIMLHINY